MQKLVSKNYPNFIFMISSFGVAASLFASEVMKLVPCKACWYQRIALFPMVFLALAAQRSKDKKFAWIIMILSGLGAIVAAMQSSDIFLGTNLLSIIGCGSEACIGLLPIEKSLPVGSLLIFVFIYLLSTVALSDAISNLVSKFSVDFSLFRQNIFSWVGAVFVMSLIATSGSLYYSEIMGLTPCILCWIQRIFMYPLTIVTGVMLFSFKKPKAIYILALAIPGILIAGYHVFLQAFQLENVLFNCSVATPCQEVQYAFGGIFTIAVQSLVAFGIIISAAIWGLRKNKNTGAEKSLFEMV